MTCGWRRNRIPRTRPGGLVAAGGDVGGYLRVGPALVHRRRNRREPHRAPRRAGTRVRGASRSTARTPGVASRSTLPSPARPARCVRLGTPQPLPDSAVRRARRAGRRPAGVPGVAGSPAAPAARRTQRRCRSTARAAGCGHPCGWRQPPTARGGCAGRGWGTHRCARGTGGAAVGCRRRIRDRTSRHRRATALRNGVDAVFPPEHGAEAVLDAHGAAASMS